MDSSSIMVILARGRFKGKSEATKSELSEVSFPVLVDPVSLYLVTLTKLEVQYPFLLCLCSVVHSL